jgi:hypothetical protein
MISGPTTRAGCLCPSTQNKFKRNVVLDICPNVVGYRT